MISPANRQQQLSGNNFSEADQHWMRYALSLANKAFHVDEVPVGAVLISENKIIGEGFNSPIQQCDPTAHAEIIALRNASRTIQNYRLVNTTLYVTLEPCLMCVGAIVHARVGRLVFGAFDSRVGAASLFEKENLNHKVHCEGGLFSEESANLLSEFFKNKRTLCR